MRIPIRIRDASADLDLVADDTGAVASAFGLVLDAQAIFGGPRLKRAAVVIDNGKVVSVAVEPSPGEGESADEPPMLRS